MFRFQEECVSFAPPCTSEEFAHLWESTSSGFSCDSVSSKEATSESESAGFCWGGSSESDGGDLDSDLDFDFDFDLDFDLGLAGDVSFRFDVNDSPGKWFGSNQ